MENFCAGYRIILKWIRTEVVAILDFIIYLEKGNLAWLFAQILLNVKNLGLAY
jgi:hypothetical protein